jgi:hypothetical protein
VRQRSIAIARRTPRLPVTVVTSPLHSATGSECKRLFSTTTLESTLSVTGMLLL